tara:strand:+ start:3516 stop:4262 length:747 start_codon:yes stop_codon:yes gene_type:complete
MQAEKAIDYIDNWKKCDISRLVNHFHFIKGKDISSQYQRVQSMTLKTDSLKASLLKNDIKSMAIHMGLSKAQAKPEELSFSPVFSVIGTIGKPTYDDFSILEGDPKGIVPESFKQALSNNWLMTDQSMIDDLFVAVSTDKNSPQLQRLHSYQITREINDLLFSILTDKGIVSKMKSLHFHLGADMNKYSDKYAFTFSPVIELVIEKLDDEELLRVAKLGMRSNISLMDDEDDSIFIEYLKPCPSTCNE